MIPDPFTCIRCGGEAVPIIGTFSLCPVCDKPAPVLDPLPIRWIPMRRWFWDEAEFDDETTTFGTWGAAAGYAHGLDAFYKIVPGDREAEWIIVEARSILKSVPLHDGELHDLALFDFLSATELMTLNRIWP